MPATDTPVTSANSNETAKLIISTLSASGAGWSHVDGSPFQRTNPKTGLLTPYAVLRSPPDNAIGQDYFLLIYSESSKAREFHRVVVQLFERFLPPTSRDQTPRKQHWVPAATPTSAKHPTPDANGRVDCPPLALELDNGGAGCFVGCAILDCGVDGAGNPISHNVFVKATPDYLVCTTSFLGTRRGSRSAYVGSYAPMDENDEPFPLILSTNLSNMKSLAVMPPDGNGRLKSGVMSGLTRERFSNSWGNRLDFVGGWRAIKPLLNPNLRFKVRDAFDQDKVSAFDILVYKCSKDREVLLGKYRDVVDVSGLGVTPPKIGSDTIDIDGEDYVRVGVSALPFADAFVKL